MHIETIIKINGLEALPQFDYISNLKVCMVNMHFLQLYDSLGHIDDPGVKGFSTKFK
jgi:hypothetical protein